MKINSNFSMTAIDLRCEGTTQEYVPNPRYKQYATLLLRKSAYIRTALQSIDPKGILLLMGPDLDVPEDVWRSPEKKIAIETNPARLDLSPLENKDTTTIHADLQQFPFNEYEQPVGDYFTGTQPLRRILEHMGPVRERFEELLNLLDAHGGLNGCLLFNATTQLSGPKTSMRTGVLLQMLANNLRPGARIHSLNHEIDPLLDTSEASFLPDTWEAVAGSFDEPLGGGHVRKHCRFDHVGLTPRYKGIDAMRAVHASAAFHYLQSDLLNNKCAVETIERDPKMALSKSRLPVVGSMIHLHNRAFGINRILRRDFKTEKALKKKK